MSNKYKHLWLSYILIVSLIFVTFYYSIENQDKFNNADIESRMTIKSYEYSTNTDIKDNNETNGCFLRLSSFPKRNRLSNIQGANYTFIFSLKCYPVCWISCNIDINNVKRKNLSVIKYIHNSDGKKRLNYFTC